MSFPSEQAIHQAYDEQAPHASTQEMVQQLNTRGVQKQPQKVLIIHKLNFAHVTAKAMANLLGCFGNVTKVLLNLETSFAMVELESSQQALAAMGALKGRRFFGQKLKITFSNYQLLDFRLIAKSHTSKFASFINQTRFFRYRTHLTIRPNAVSTVLHFTGLSNHVNNNLLLLLVSQVHSPLKIVPGPNSRVDARMFWVEFEEEHQAMEVLSMLHNLVLDDKLVKVSFSHTRLA